MNLKWTWIFCIILVITNFPTNTQTADDDYQIGVGIADITGPAAEINMMGYAKGGQDTAGIHFRLYSRAFIIVDQLGSRVCYVNTDLAMISQAVHNEVIRQIEDKYPGIYSRKNTLLGATHTHSGPGGFLQYVLYIISSQGFIWQNFNAIVSGIVRSIERAHNNLQHGKILYNRGELLDSNINRSPASYMNNPLNERRRYKYDTDKTMEILKFVSRTDEPIGLLDWFAVHPTSMNNTNRLISGDNKGYAEYCFEKMMNPNSLPGEGPFVAAFANSNQGDVSPNIKGPRCTNSGAPCDIETSTCNDVPENLNYRIRPLNNPPNQFEAMENNKLSRNDLRRYENAGSEALLRRRPRDARDNLEGDLTNSTHGNEPKPPTEKGVCIASGPGHDMFESTKIIGERQCKKAKELWDSANTVIKGSVEFIQQYVDMSNVVVVLADNKTARTCPPAMGYSFAAGTTDGPGAFNFHQGSTQSTPFWNFVRDFLKRPSPAMLACHHPKPILLDTGEMLFPYSWQPSILPVQLLKIGQVLIVGLPAEFTTMAGRRVRETVKKEYEKFKPGSNVIVIIAGLANAYSSYVTTIEEYIKQRYEAASTIFGPYTLDAYLQELRMLTGHLASRKEVEHGPSPPNLLSKQISFKPGVVMDSAGRGKNFGDVIVQPNLRYSRGSTVTVSFVAANPRNDLQTEKTYLTVEKLDSDKQEWKVIATDGDWDTKFYWLRTNRILGESEAIITWDIPKDADPGVYRIRHFGVSKNLLQRLHPYVGISNSFKVDP